MKKRIHVNQHKIKAREPKVITVKTYKSNRYGKEVIIYGQDGKEAARVIYQPDDPLSCGARCWIETENKVSVR